MAAEDFIVDTLASATIPEDTLTMWRPIIKDDLPCIQIDQSDGMTAR
ncbi:hypothetical protein [Arthrobacter sp. fls2-241-R2A-200]|nr:hypothetical protein [Arthrobacter sp. fls2-241-R2A-200]